MVEVCDAAARPLHSSGVYLCVFCVTDPLVLHHYSFTVRTVTAVVFVQPDCQMMCCGCLSDPDLPVTMPE